MIVDKLYLWIESALVFGIRGLLWLLSRSPRLSSRSSADDALRALGIAVARYTLGKSGNSDPEFRASIRGILVSTLPQDSWNLVPTLKKRDVPVQNTWTYQNEVMEWDLPTNAKVLDVGSGGWPFNRATHLADKYPDQTTHRVEAIVRDRRPFFEVDLERMPFEDNAYDFVFCSHVLEHMDNPGLAIRELMRVGRKGYIEVPTRLSDVMFNFTRLPNHHRWHGLMVGSTLVLTEWNDWERRDLGNTYFDALHSGYSNQFQEFFERNRDLFFASCHWVDKINFLIIDKRGCIIDSSGSSHKL